MIRLRYKVFAVLSVLLSVFLFGRYYKKPLTTSGSAAILKPTDKEEILINPVKHTITVVTASGIKTETLPERESEIDIGKDNNVKITASQFGFEHSPFVYAGFSNHFRYGAGLDALYFKKLDLGIGLAGSAGTSTVVFAQLSYNVFDNVRLGITLDHQEHIGVGISLRI